MKTQRSFSKTNRGTTFPVHASALGGYSESEGGGVVILRLAKELEDHEDAHAQLSLRCVMTWMEAEDLGKALLSASKHAWSATQEAERFNRK